tara:strand:+ start:409 stop:543 length:135 start_codon:yes stop_codon:yes gene_type:complete
MNSGELKRVSFEDLLIILIEKFLIYFFANLKAASTTDFDANGYA